MTKHSIGAHSGRALAGKSLSSSPLRVSSPIHVLHNRSFKLFTTHLQASWKEMSKTADGLIVLFFIFSFFFFNSQPALPPCFLFLPSRCQNRACCAIFSFLYISADSTACTFSSLLWLVLKRPLRKEGEWSRNWPSSDVWGWPDRAKEKGTGRARAAPWP